METGWGGESGDEDLLYYQMTDIAETKEGFSDTDMFRESEPKVIPNTPSDEENLEVSDSMLLDGELAESSKAYHDALGSASQVWMDIYGGANVKKEGVSSNSAFDLEFDDETECKEKWPSSDSSSGKDEDEKTVPTVEYNRKPKKGGFLSSLDNMNEDEEKLEKEVESRSKELDDNVPKRTNYVKKCKFNEEVKVKDKSLKELEYKLDWKKFEVKVKVNKENSKKTVQKCKFQNKPAIESVFKFSYKDKVDAQKPSQNNSSKSKEVESTKEPGGKKNISSVFKFQDDLYVLENEAKKMEPEKLAVRTKVKTKVKKRQYMAKMAKFSQSLTGSQSSQELSQDSKSSDRGAEFKIIKTRKSSKKKKSAPVKYNNVNEFDEARDYIPSIDELLKIPERSDDGGKTMDEVLDDLDKEIAERKRKHEEEMEKIDTDITAEKLRQGERRERMKENALLRDRLEEEITESKLRRMFSVNIEYLDNIKRGTIESSRHKAFYKSSKMRHSLYYTMITDPFTDDQLEWTLNEIGKVWMKNKREHMDNNEYVWKVLLAECFIKFYMDFFKFDKAEAEKRISETPFHKKVESDDETSSEDEL